MFKRRFDDGPTLFVKAQPKAIRPRTCGFVHLEYVICYFLRAEFHIEAVDLWQRIGVEMVEEKIQMIC